MNCLKIKDIFRVLRNKSLVFNECLIISFATFEPSQFTVKSKDVFFNGVSLLLSLSARSSRKKGGVGKFADRITPSVCLECFHP